MDFVRSAILLKQLKNDDMNNIKDVRAVSRSVASFFVNKFKNIKKINLFFEKLLQLVWLCDIICMSIHLKYNVDKTRCNTKHISMCI